MPSVEERAAVVPASDLFDGFRTSELTNDRDILERCGIPIMSDSGLILPNFFLEITNHDDAGLTSRQRARRDGAYGARIMHMVRSLGKAEPIYGENAYAYSVVYGGRYLNLYAHFVAAPRAAGEQPKCRMYPVERWDLTDIKDFPAAVFGFRSARELASRDRDESIGSMTQASQTETLLARLCQN